MTAFSKVMRLSGVRRFLPEIMVITLAAGLHFFNLPGFPSFFIDEGAYVGRALVFKQTGDPTTPGGTFYYHPFLVWILLGIAFLGLGFPENWNSSVVSLYLVPRSLFAFLGVVDVLLTYAIVLRVYRRRDYALLSSALLAVTPLSVRYLRMVLLDSVMLFFLLLSMVILSRSLTIKRSGVSGLFFGLALLSKLPAAFFLVPVSLAIVSSKLERMTLKPESIRAKIPILIVWVVMAILVMSIWPLYAVITGQTQGLLNSLTYQTSREAPLAWDLIISRLIERDLFLFAGVAGVAYGLARRDIIGGLFSISYLGTFVILGLRVSSYYLIPVLPFLSLLAARLILDSAGYIGHKVLGQRPFLRRFPIAVGTLLVGGLAVSGILLSSQALTASQIDAVNYVVVNAQDGALVISNPSYAWTIRASRASLVAYDWFEAPWGQLPPSPPKTYLIVDPGFSTAISQIPDLQALYERAGKVEATFSTSGFVIEVRTT